MPVQKRLTAEQRLRLIERVLQDGVSATKACREFGVSRFSFYKWLGKYQEIPKAGLEALRDRNPRGKNHWRHPSSEIIHKILKIVREHPEYSCRRIQRKLVGKDGDLRISPHGVHSILVRLGLSGYEDRLCYVNRLRIRDQGRVTLLSPQERLSTIQKVLSEGWSVADVCRAYGISRHTFYKWKDRFDRAEKEKKLLVLSDQRPAGDQHWKSIDDLTTKRILEAAAAQPELSARQIAREFGFISQHGVHNVLTRHDLSTFEKRLAYARQHGYSMAAVRPAVSWQDKLKQVWEQFLPTRAPAPPPQVPFGIWLRRQGRFAPYFLFFLVFLFGFFEWGRLLGSATTVSQALGWIFASVALSMGTVFFLYSLKYYFTLAVVLSFSREASEEIEHRQSYAGELWLSRLFNLGSRVQGLGYKGDEKKVEFVGGLEPDLSQVTLERHPFISIHLPMYNEKRVAERILKACTSFDYPSTSSGQARYEIIVADDSTDETTAIVERFAEQWNKPMANDKSPITNEELHSLKPKIKIIHRDTREGFKGGALKEALKHTDPRAEFIVVFDADFVPYPDTLELFLKYFQANAGSLRPGLASSVQRLASGKKGRGYQQSNIAAIQGYQWHVLNKSENWITKGVRSEYAGSYVIERLGEELYGGLKQIAGSVYMIRRDLVDRFGWGTSLTEDFQLTLRLYEAGYKVIYTPYIQAPSECVSTLKRLIRQRMRWAEGHSYNIRKKFFQLLFGRWADIENSKFKVQSSKLQLKIQNSKEQKRWMPSPLTLSEKLEFFYLSPYYLQAAFFLLGTFSWLLSETIFRIRLPFWTAVWGWSLVLTNLLSLPLMNMVGLFLEEAEERDFAGILSFILLSYILVPFQAYASVKGFLEPKEGPWFRTPKTGRITDILTRGRFYRFIRGIFPERSPIFSFSTHSLRALNPLGLPAYALGEQTDIIHLGPFKIGLKQRRKTGRVVLVGLIISVMLLNYLSFFTPQTALAQGSQPTIEQQINIIDQEYSSVGTDQPGDNSLGLINFDPADYNGETVYFEAVMRCDSCTGGNTEIDATFVDDTGVTEVVTISTTSSTYTWVQSSSITPSANEYTVEITRDATAGTAYIKAARLVIVQTDATMLTDTQTQVEVGDSQNDFSNTTYSALTDHKIYLYDTNKFSGTETIHFEVTLHTDSGSNTVSAQLLQCTSSSNCSTGTAVSGSEVTHTGDTNWTRKRTVSGITLTDDANFAVQVKMDAGTGDVANAKIIIEQTDASGLTDIEMVQQYVNTLTSATDITYTDQDFLNQFNPDNFDAGTFTYFFEITMKQTGFGEAYAQLWNDTNNSEIYGSYVYTFATSYERKRSGDITSYMPTAAKNMDTQLRISRPGETAYSSSSWLIIEISNLQIPENLLFAIPFMFFMPYIIKWWRRREERLVYRVQRLAL